jgi:predicted nucleic acid-binding protein
MKVIIDTNIFCQDYFLEKPHFRVLFEGASVVPATIHIPQVVIDELINRYKEDLENSVSNLNRAVRTLNLLTKQDNEREIDVNYQLEVYKSFLLSKLKERGVEIVDYPQTPHKEIVARDLARKKPFKKNGAGYRDCLIWENVKKICLWGEYQVAFITNNPKDFGEGPYIDKALAEEVLNKQSLKIFQSLKHFNDELIVPKLKKLEEIKVLLQKEKLELFDLRQWLQDNLLDLLRNYDLEDVLAGFPDGIGSAWIREIIEFHDIKVEDLSELENANKLLTVYVEFKASCSIDSYWEDYINHSEVREFWGKQDEPFSSVSTWLEETIKLTIDLVIDGKTNKVDSEEIITIEADYGEIDFGR